MKETIPIIAISFQDITGRDPAEFSNLLSDKSLIYDLTVDLDDIANDVAYLLVLEDHSQEMSYPVYAKRYEVVFPPEKEVETEGGIKYRKIAEYDYDSFEIQFDKDNFPSIIVVETAAN